MQKKIVLRNSNGIFEAEAVRYSNRVVCSFGSTWIFYTLIFLVGVINSSFLNALYLVLFFFIFNLLEYCSWCKNQIVYISLCDSDIVVEYLQGDKLMSIKDKKENFKFQKKRIWYKIKGPIYYLSICHKNNILMRQFEIKDIDSLAFDFIVNTFS